VRRKKAIAFAAVAITALGCGPLVDEQNPCVALGAPTCPAPNPKNADPAPKITNTKRPTIVLKARWSHPVRRVNIAWSLGAKEISSYETKPFSAIAPNDGRPVSITVSTLGIAGYHECSIEVGGKPHKPRGVAFRSDNNPITCFYP
jgi:hypothetical protein